MLSDRLTVKIDLRWTLKEKHLLMVLQATSNGQVWDQASEKVSIDIRLSP
jgi:hypothetical protein